MYDNLDYDTLFAALFDGSDYFAPIILLMLAVWVSRAMLTILDKILNGGN